MQPDWEVIRMILLKIDDLPAASSLDSNSFVNERVGSDTAAYNIIVLFDYGLIDGILKKKAGGLLCCETIRLTPNGSSFVDIIREGTIWSRIKEQAQENNLKLSMNAISALKMKMEQFLPEKECEN